MSGVSGGLDVPGAVGCSIGLGTRACPTRNAPLLPDRLFVGVPWESIAPCRFSFYCSHMLQASGAKNHGFNGLVFKRMCMHDWRMIFSWFSQIRWFVHNNVFVFIPILFMPSHCMLLVVRLGERCGGSAVSRPPRFFSSSSWRIIQRSWKLTMFVAKFLQTNHTYRAHWNNITTYRKTQKGTRKGLRPSLACKCCSSSDHPGENHPQLLSFFPSRRTEFIQKRKRRGKN